MRHHKQATLAVINRNTRAEGGRGTSRSTDTVAPPHMARTTYQNRGRAGSGTVNFIWLNTGSGFMRTALSAYL